MDFIKKAIDWISNRVVIAATGLGLPSQVSSALSGIAATFSQKPDTDWEGIPLEAGHYIFYAHSPSKMDKGIFLDNPLMTQTKEGKRIQINWILYHLETQDVEIGVRIYDNPIPMFVVWGLVVTVLVGIMSLSASLVLTDVRKVLVTPGGMILMVIILLLVLPIAGKKLKALKGG